MKSKTILTIISIIIVSLTLYTLSRLRVDAHRSNYTYRLHAAVLPLPTEMINALAGEFKGMVANYLLLEAASFIGSKQSVNASPEEWGAVARLLEQSSNLDPYFKSTYRLAQATLPWEAKKYDETLNILERSKNHRTWDWEPGFNIGFDYYFFLNDKSTAAKKMIEASKIPDAPVLLTTLASRLASQAGETKTAIDFLIAMHEKTDDEKLKETLKKRIIAIQGVELLQSAVDIFQTKIGRIPHTLDELVDSSILPNLPANPYSRPYTLNNGKVDF